MFQEGEYTRTGREKSFHSSICQILPEFFSSGKLLYVKCGGGNEGVGSHTLTVSSL
jgi:hypothetical protein